MANLIYYIWEFERADFSFGTKNTLDSFLEGNILFM
jgi:hypothetical protein